MHKTHKIRVDTTEHRQRKVGIRTKFYNRHFSICNIKQPHTCRCNRRKSYTWEFNNVFLPSGFLIVIFTLYRVVDYPYCLNMANLRSPVTTLHVNNNPPQKLFSVKVVSVDFLKKSMTKIDIHKRSISSFSIEKWEFVLRA